MNISQAKQQIKNAVSAYLTKNEYGRYVIPVEKQRPLFLMGPPGIGKTAGVGQAASELGIGLVSYSMTHHTRQSVLGLPVIRKISCLGKEFEVSEYTMSEIIASVYRMMEDTGVRNGILFLDEINCVSETLTPVMLQFLQYKTFGCHALPEGWIVVTAGNPPEYNRSAREFDTATWDRLKRIDIDPDFESWKEYARSCGIHSSVITYLDVKKDNFYSMRTSAEGKRFVTARGWEDLSQMLSLYESNETEADEMLMSQYIQDPEIAADFSAYYSLYKKYRNDYHINDIINGTESDEIRSRASAAFFDERFALCGLLVQKITYEASQVLEEQKFLSEMMAVLKEYKAGLDTSDMSETELFDTMCSKYRDECRSAGQAGILNEKQLIIKQRVSDKLEKIGTEIRRSDRNVIWDLVKEDFDECVRKFGERTETVSFFITNVLKFTSDVFSDGNELSVLVNELASGKVTAEFLSKFRVEEFLEFDKEHSFRTVHDDLIRKIDDLDL